jgi:hypothetical protein
MSTFPIPVSKDICPPDPPYFGENQPQTLRLYPLCTSPEFPFPRTIAILVTNSLNLDPLVRVRDQNALRDWSHGMALTVANYTFGTKEAQPEEDPSVLSRLNRLQEHYEKYGMRRSCEAILIVCPSPSLLTLYHSIDPFSLSTLYLLHLYSCSSSR